MPVKKVKNNLMTKKILINALDSDECRIVIIKNNKLEEFYFETAAKEIIKGNIYKGIITRVEPSLQAAFVDYGAGKNGFLQKQEIHSDYFLDNNTGKRGLQNIIKKGQELVVQVIKDPIMKKGAVLTTFISLPGRFCVLMLGSSNKGVSRQISDEVRRKELKGIIEKIKVPEGFGLIVRTAGKNSTKTMLTRDIRYLMRVWKNINKKSIKAESPSILYKEQILAVRSLRDHLTSDVKEILIDDPNVLNEVNDFIKIIAPKQKKIVKQFKGQKPIFTKYQIEEQIASIFKTRVSLKSGSDIVINQTEALVAIDVNSGKSTAKKNIEATAFHTNLEASEEVARQLRLRDIGGLIVIDFIDMKEKKHKAEVIKNLKKFLKTDKAKTKVGTISIFGLLEMSRQRIRPAIIFGSFETCKNCKGLGMAPSIETLGLRFLRQLKLKTIKSEVKTVIGFVPKQVAKYLLNKKRSELLDIELRRKVSITLEADFSMLPEESKILCTT